MAWKKKQPDRKIIRKLSPAENFWCHAHDMNAYICVVVACRYEVPVKDSVTARMSSLPVTVLSGHETSSSESKTHHPVPLSATHNTLSSTPSSPPSSSSSPLSPSTLYPALATVISSQPHMRVGIHDPRSISPSFIHIPAIDLFQQVTFHPLTTASRAEYETELMSIQADLHNRHFEDVDTRPPWRITVVWNTESQSEVDVLFTFHHALFDGLSGKQFHQELLLALNAPSSPPPSSLSDSLLSYPSPPPLIEGEDVAIPFRFTKRFFASLIWSELKPTALKRRHASRSTHIAPWSGAASTFKTPYAVRCVTIDVCSASAAAVLARCRAEGTSLTGLMHALALASFARRVRWKGGMREEEYLLKGVTPMSLRPYMKVKGLDEGVRGCMRYLLTSQDHTFPAEEVVAMRAASQATPQTNGHAHPPNGNTNDKMKEVEDLDTQIWKVARRVKADMKDHATRMPLNDYVGLMKYVPDWEDYIRKKEGEARGEAWEMSNIGVFQTPLSKETTKATSAVEATAAESPLENVANEDSMAQPSSTTNIPTNPEQKVPAGQYRVTRAVFTNGAMVTGAPLVVSIASVKGGNLTAALTWQPGSIEEELVMDVARDLTRWMGEFREGKKFEV